MIENSISMPKNALRKYLANISGDEKVSHGSL
jgi:hypothetical protein